MTLLTVEHQLENVLMDLSVWGCAYGALPVQGTLLCTVCTPGTCSLCLSRTGFQPELWIWVNVWSGMSQLELPPPVQALIPCPTLAC